MIFDDSTNIRILVCSLITATLLYVLSFIVIMLPIWILFVVIAGISALFIRAKNIKEAIIYGALLGLATVLFLSIFLIRPLINFTIYSVIFSIVGVLFSYFIIEKIKHNS